jgi:hypothetical protein
MVERKKKFKEYQAVKEDQHRWQATSNKAYEMDDQYNQPILSFAINATTSHVISETTKWVCVRVGARLCVNTRVFVRGCVCERTVCLC